MLGRGEHGRCVVSAGQVRPIMFFPWVLYFQFYVHWGACHVGVPLSTNFVFSVSAPPHQVPLADRVLVVTFLQRFVLARWWVVAQLSLLLVVFGGGGFLG